MGEMRGSVKGLALWYHNTSTGVEPIFIPSQAHGAYLAILKSAGHPEISDGGAAARSSTSINRAVELSLQRPGIARRTDAKVAFRAGEGPDWSALRQLPAGVDISTSLP
jgi:hypothetical protein